jgi:hypothetical protein
MGIGEYAVQQISINDIENQQIDRLVFNNNQ